ncbi:glycosyltransferase family 4 protein [Peribacillus alkalitolerans]|uniref:glycosyltransferase family 4 protein n=1 Tax=Peribacillus alkalitolerans TaxID=1550385 RepID=UPI0013D2CD81|nr:glycosyltransferase family 4 protein [Peribacillus alkalitolerans]
MKVVYYAHLPTGAKENDIETMRSLFNTFYSLFDHLESDHEEKIGLCLSGIMVKNLADESFLRLSEQTIEEIYPVEYKKYGINLLSKVRMFLQKGRIELVGTTFVPFPLTIMQTSDLIEWQIKEAISLYEHYLHYKPKWFIPPRGAFMSGIDEYILKCGYENLLIDFNTMKYKEPKTDLPVTKSPYGLLCIQAIFNGTLEETISINDMRNSIPIKENHSRLKDESEHSELDEVSYLDFSYFGIGDRNISLFEENDSKWIIELIEMEIKFIQKKERLLLDTSTISEILYLWSKVADSEVCEEQKQSYKNKFYMLLDSIDNKNLATPNDTLSHDQALNILMLTWEYPPHIVGGLARHVFGLSKALAALGHNVHVVTVGMNGEGTDYIESGVHVHRIEMQQWDQSSFIEWVGCLNVKMGEKISYLIESEIKPDMIHAHDWLVGAAAIAAGQRWDIPLLATIHATENGRHNGIHNNIQFFIHEQERKLIDHADQLIVCSEFMKNELMEIFSTPSDKLAVIANGVEKSDIIESVITNQEDKKAYSIFSWGRMVPEKGFDILIEATDHLKTANIDVKVVIAGRGPLLETYREMIQNRGLEHQIQLIGFIQDEVRDQLLHQCDLTIFPSTYEPFGIVALEAMISGKPVIVSETGGLKAIIQNGESGLLFKTGDPVDLAKKIEYIINHPTDTEKMALKGKEVASKLFCWERVGIQTAHLIKEYKLTKRIERGERNELSSTGSR